MSRPLPSTRRSGFTVMELLVVVAIMAIVGTLSAPMLRSLSGAGNLTNGGNMAASLIELARQSSLTQNKPTAVVVVAAAAGDADAANRAYGVFQLDSENSAWSQIGRWHYLPTGIAFDPTAPAGGLTGFFQSATNALTPPLSASTAFRLHGQDIGSFSSQVFLPSGHLYGQASPVLLRLIDVHSATGSRTNYYHIVLNPDTGRAKIVRP